jgi:hypothetical protein
MRRLLAIFLAATPLLAGCVVGARPLAVPEDDEPAVAVLSDALPEAMGGVGRHSWIAVRQRGSREWRRYEVLGNAGRYYGDPFEGDDGDDVRLHGLVHGAEAEPIIACLDRELPRYNEEEDYGFWPGPNCNTFVERMARRCGIHVDLPATAVGRDYRGLVGASVTSRGTGVQVESPLVGVKLGLAEGIELHLFSLALGLDLWPPAIIVPVGPGRIGFDDR